MTRKSVVLVLGLCALVAVVLADEEVMYSDKYDSIDVDQILANKRMRERYYNCFLGTGECYSADAKFFKDRFPEALVTQCKKCTPKQKENFEKIVLYYREKEPEKWNAVLKSAINNSQSKKDRV